LEGTNKKLWGKTMSLMLDMEMKAFMRKWRNKIFRVFRLRREL
jgi:hypothetical protein